MAPAPRPLRSAPALAAASAALALTLPAAAPAPAAPAAPEPAPAPVCGSASGADFPLATRIQDGPADYPAGGEFRSWELELRNTTGSPCAGVHPVLVLADEERVLRPEQIRLEFYDARAARWRPVAFEATEEAESVGAFTGFDGFAVPARRTVTVPVRLAFRADAVPEEVVVNAALVQRRGADGDWVGRSDDYRLTIGPPVPAAPSRPAASPSAPADPPDGPARPTPAPDGSAPPTADRDPGGSARPDPLPDSPPDSLPALRPRPEPAHPRPELAHTGPEDAAPLAPWAAALALTGALLTRAARHLTRRPRP
ncbi:hypothetical protein AB0E83_27865 [Streptomyces sp. NPDC035033]|uniref:hypothetical protein n=1 Tax=Streptomyces sp. NPDC035033 TaxID=3155368 RepID=UPI0033FEACDE